MQTNKQPPGHKSITKQQQKGKLVSHRHPKATGWQKGVSGPPKGIPSVSLLTHLGKPFGTFVPRDSKTIVANLTFIILFFLIGSVARNCSSPNARYRCWSQITPLLRRVGWCLHPVRFSGSMLFMRLRVEAHQPVSRQATTFANSRSTELLACGR